MNSRNPLVVLHSIEGLGRLEDAGALAVIEGLAGQWPESRRRLFAKALPWYRDARAYRLMERWEPVAAYREADIRQVEMARRDGL